MLEIQENRYKNKILNVFLATIVLVVSSMNFQQVHPETVLSGVVILLSIFVKNENKRFLELLKLTNFIMIISLLFEITFNLKTTEAFHFYSFLIIALTSIPLISTFIKRKNHLISFVVASILSFLYYSYDFYLAEPKTKTIFVSFVFAMVSVYILNKKRIDLEKINSKKEEELEHLIKSFPETIVLFKYNSFSIINKENKKVSEELSKFLNDNFILNKSEEEKKQYNEDGFYYEINELDFKKNARLFYLKDITENVLQEQELERNKTQLANSSKLAALGEMAGGVAHEINNPLQILSLSIEQLRLLLMAKNISVSECDKICDQMDSTVDRVFNIVKGMKLISRDGQQDPFEKIDAKLVLEETLSFCKEKFKNNGVKIIFFEEQHDEYSILGQKVRLSQVLLNLLNNAFDAISKQKNKTIRVFIGKKDENLLMYISDNGPGVPDQLVQKVFQPFFTTKEIGKGTGLGLSISKGIIEQHKGKFYLDENNRSQFMIEIPLYNEQLVKDLIEKRGDAS